MKKGIIAVLFAVFVFAAFIQTGFCEITNEIRYNGRLKGYTVPLSGTVRKLRFEYFNAENGGQSLYYEEHNVTPNDNGVFSVVLTPNIEWQEHRDIWLQLSIDSRPMTPREKIMTMPYAQHSKTAENAQNAQHAKTAENAENAQYANAADNADKAKTAENGVPAGTVIAFAGDTSNAPTGYLLCDGTTYEEASYPDLFKAIKHIYGTPGSGKFKVPDFRGMFLRGAGSQTIINYPNINGNVNTTYSATIGQFQGDAIRNIVGTGTADRRNWNGVFIKNSDYGTYGGEGEGGTSKFTFNASKVVPVALENRPANYAVNYYIKY
jgi:hypothetical protein